MQSLQRSMPCMASRAMIRACTKQAYGFHRNGNIQIIRHAYSKSKSKATANTTPSSNSNNKKPSPKPLPFQPAQSQSKASNNSSRVSKNENESQQDNNKKSSMRDLVRERWIYLLGAGAAVVCLGYFTASLTMYWRQEPAPCYPFGCEPDTPTGRPSIQSPYEFDMHLDKSEHRFGITKLRRQLGALAHGHVLEVAIGTGRNFEFYDWGVVTKALLTSEEREKRGKKSSGWLPAWAGGSGDGKDADDEKSDNAILSFTGVDVSPGMLDIALRRVRQLVPHMHELIPKNPSFAMLVARQRDARASSQRGGGGGHVLSFLSERIRLLQSDVQTGLPAPPNLPSTPSSSTSASSTPTSTSSLSSSSSSPQKYDTILQTFGLCSVRDPVALLTSMASVLQPETGRILLLEHGRSIWDIVNGLLDRGARSHHERFGCWWNRDIEVIIYEAARRVPGLEILRFERPGWITGGTHIVVEMRLNNNSIDANKGDGGKGGGKDEKTATGWAQVLPSLLTTKGGDESKKN